MGILTGVGPLAIPELEGLGPETGVEVDRGPLHVQPVNVTA